MSELHRAKLGLVPTVAAGPESFGVAIDHSDREGWQADRDVLRPLGPWRAVTNPLPGATVDSLTRLHIEKAVLMLNPNGAAQDDRVLVELGALARLGPTGRAVHLRHADRLLAVAGSTDELGDRLRRVSRRRYLDRSFDQSRHLVSMTRGLSQNADDKTITSRSRVLWACQRAIRRGWSLKVR